MSKDPLVDFINQNREAFEESFDVDRNWAKMRQDRSVPSEPVQGRRTIGPSWLQWAASLILVAGMTYWITKVDFGDSSGSTVNNHYHISISDISPELAEVEHHYTQSIAEKMELVKNTQPDPELMDELSFMDEQMKMLDGEMQSNINNEEIVKAIIKNYRMKLNLLEEMLDDINQSKNKNYNDGKTKIIEL